jgi:hypothetical protein
MDDAQVRARIEQLVAEEHQLWDAEAAGDASPADRERLQELKVGLDQCWDLLRQRRAKREFAEADDSTVRDPSVVEGYQQ